MKQPLLILAAGLLWVGCSPSATFNNGVFANESVRYRVGPLPPGWHRVKLSGGQVAFVERETSAVVHANASCTEGDAPLRVLAGHLLIGYTERRILSERRFAFAGREAWRTVVIAKLDGVPVKLDLLVLKKDGCVFDLAYSASPEQFDRRHGDFTRFLEGFRKLATQGGSG